jgi:hypothetical protein
MIEPVYVLENGQRVPYVPIEVNDHREAYAATLHVLFKHVADFHICIVQTFSKKYGIPEDEIMQTIQDSEEFKNMRVDTVLHHDGLGYISPMPPTPQAQAPVPAPTPEAQEPVPVPAPTPEAQEPVPVPAPTPEAQEPAAKKRIVKKKSPDTDSQATTTAVQATAVQATAVQATAVQSTAATQETVLSGKKVVRKKVTPATATATSIANPATETIVEKKKVIRKKVTPPPTTTPELDGNDMHHEMPMQKPNVNPPDTSDDVVQLLATNAQISQKKIIRKKK